jgi:phosphatidylinositol dimannoside acyltransferase
MAETPRPFTDSFTVGGYKLGSLIARATPGFVTQGTVSLLAPGVALSLRSKRAVIERNLQRVDPSLKGLALRRASQRAFDSYMRYYTESFRLPSLSADHVNRCFTVDGYQHLEEALEKGNGVIFAIPHLGGWEWAGRWMAERGLPMTVIVEPLQPPELFEWFVKLRSELGMNVVPLGPDAAPTILATLKKNGLVCLLSDRDIQRSGVEVDFFGEKTTLPAGPAMLGIRGNTPVLPVAIYFTDSIDGHHAVVRPPVHLEKVGSLRESVAVGTQAVARELEILIRRAPEQWHMFQPNWPSDPGY